MSDFQSIIKAIRKKEFAPVYILMGEEPYYLDRIAEELENKVVGEEDKEFDQNILYGADVNAARVMESAGQFPLFSSTRLVMLKESQSMQRAKSELDKLASYVLSPNPQTVLAIIYKGDKLNTTSALIKVAKKNKDIVVFDSPKIKEFQLGGIIKNHCQANKISIDDKAVEVLVANVGSSLDSLFSQLEKLRISLKDGSGRITSDMVHDQIGLSKEFNNFELANALARRDYFQAIRIVKHFEENSKANPTVVITSVIFNLYQKLLIAAFSHDKSDRALMEALQLKTPYALKDIRTGLASYNAAQLVNAIHAIRDFDTRSKGINSYQKEYPLLTELVCRLITL